MGSVGGGSRCVGRVKVATNPRFYPVWRVDHGDVQLRIAIASMFRVNQAMSRVYSIGTAMAILL